MRTMTRPEFEAYEERVEEVLARIGNSIDEADRKDFGEVAAVAREVVEMRRAHLEITEQKGAAEPPTAEQRETSAGSDDEQTQPAGTGEKYYEQTAEAAHEALNEIRIAREALGRIASNEHTILPASAYRGDLERGYEMAGNYAVLYDNKYVLEAARTDTELADQLVLFEKSLDEFNEAIGAGAAGAPIPDIAKSDTKLLGYYVEGLNEYETDVAIADAENGLAYGGWAFGFAEYWTAEDSEAAWEKIDQRRNEILEAYAKLEQGVEISDPQTTSAEVSNDATIEAGGGHDTIPQMQVGRSSDGDWERDSNLERPQDADAASYSAGVHGEPIPDRARRDEELLGSYAKGLNQFQTDILNSVDKDQLRIERDAPGRYWSRENSDAWMTLMQRRDEVIRTRAEIEKTAETADWARLREEAVARHGEKAVAAGEELIDRLVAAGRDMRDAETHVGRPREGDKEQEARYEKFLEASAHRDEVLSQAVRAAMDGNGYLREARWHGDLKSAIAMEELRLEQRSHFYINTEQDGARHDVPADRPSRSDGAVRPAISQHHTTRLSQLEQEIHDRQHSDRDERDR